MATVSQQPAPGPRHVERAASDAKAKKTPISNIEVMREAFRLFDKDNDGNITADELFAVMSNIGQSVSRQQSVDMIRLVDTDGNGLIDFDEFCQMMENSRRWRLSSESSQGERGSKQSADKAGAPTERCVAAEDEFRPLFAAFDKDNSGYIDAAELKMTMAAVGLELSDKDVDVMMKAAGVAKGDRIFYADFVKMMVSSGLCSQPSDSGTAGTVPRALNASFCSLAVSDITDDDELQELGIAFSTFDKDNDGQITVDEVEKTIKSLGLSISREEVQLMVDLVDTDGNGSISFEEFCQLMMSYRHSELGRSTSSLAGENVLRDTFRIFDKDNDGLLSASDLRDTMQQLGVPLTAEDVKAMMKSVGVGPQGKISYADFCKILSFSEQPQDKAGVQRTPSRSVKDKRKDELKAVFRMFDKDDDGFITMKEVTEMLVSMGIKPSPSRIKEVFQQVDLDGNNQIDFNEFILLVDNYEKPMSKDREIREMFNAIDKDRSGFIDVEELKTTFTTLGVALTDRDVRTMLSEANIKGDRIFYEDFVRIIMLSLGNGYQQLSMPEARPTEPIKVNGNTAKPKSDDEFHELQVQFAQFDKNGDGRITQTEMCDVMTSLGFEVQPKEVRRILRRADSNNDGTIDFDEFRTVMSRYRHGSGSRSTAATATQPVDPKQVFKVFDKNSDGFIDEHELQATMKELGVMLSTEDLNDMFTEAGCQATRRITYAEFANMVMNAAPAQGFADLISANSARSDHDQISTAPPPADKVVCQEHTNNLSATPPEVPSSAPIKIQTIRTLVMSDQPSSPLDAGSKLSHSPPDTWKAFRVFDRNSDGYVSKSELYHTLKELGVNLSLEELNSQMKEADTNQDGCIDYAEFRQLMKGAFEIYARQAVLLHRQKSLNESTVQQSVVDRSKLRQNVSSLFISVDTDHSGRIGVDQLMQIAGTLSMNIRSKQHAKALITKYGSRGDGTINFSEFEHIRSQCAAGRERRLSERSRDAEQHLRTAFKVFDIDGNGFIDSKELSDTLTELGSSTLSQQDAEALMRAADKNGDGQIDYEEFIVMMYP